MEKLQQTLNEAIKMGWKVNGTNIYCECHIFNEYAVYYVENPGYIKSGLYSYHHLFSRDSGIMEFIEWKEPDNQVHMILGGLEKYNYMMMGPMTVQEKIEYFNNNAYLPGKQ